jgi:hypothetical protein
MKASDFDRLLAMLAILIGLGISPTLVRVALLAYLWGRFSRERSRRK